MASIVKRTTSTGETRYDVRYRTPAGVVRNKTFRRLNDAKRFVSTTEADKVRGDWLDPLAGRRPFGELAEEWLTTADIKPKTKASYRSILDQHLLPRFAHEPINRVTTSEVELYLAQLRLRRQTNTVRNVRNALSAICRYAVRCGCIRTNPVAEISTPRRNTQSEMLFLTAEQVAELATAIDGRYRLAVLLSAYTGLRAGELVGLKVGRVDLESRRIHIVESITEVHGASVTALPKNSRTRMIKIPGFLVTELTDHLAARPHRLDPYVFTAPKGGPIRHSNVYRRHFKPAAKAIGVPQLRWHDLRHTAVALMVQAGVEPLVISRILGHSSISITYDIYGHVLPSLEDHFADALDLVYAEATGPRSEPQDREQAL